MRTLAIATATMLAAVGAAAAFAAAAGPPPLKPNDPGWSGQWGVRLLGIPQVWQVIPASAHPLIATVDTGVDATFPDLRGVVVPGWDLVGNDSDTSDVARHGTDVALVIAANANNGYGIAGACPMCHVMPVRISIDRTARPTIISAGIRWAVDHGARIIIVSLVHTGVIDPSEQPAVDYAVAHGAVVIASAGNDGGTEPHYPAALRGVISVGATDMHDQLYPWATHGQWVDLAAPGCEYGSEMCGASYAPPLVAAAVALLVAAKPDLTPQQAVDALRATSVPVDGIDGGRIDVLAAARVLGILAAPAPPTAPPAAAQQLDLEQGTFTRLLRKRLTVSRGKLSIVVTRRNARSCTMTLRSGATAFRSRATATTLSISAAATAGTYTLVVACADSQPTPYSLVVTGRLLASS